MRDVGSGGLAAARVFTVSQSRVNVESIDNTKRVKP
jgi:hypothetical protein